LPNYDANGNQLNSTGAQLTWNAAAQPITVNGTTASYDALGRMVETGSGSSYKQFFYRPDGTQLGIYTGSLGSGSLSKETIPLPGGETAVYNGSGLNFIRHTDWLGSSRLATTWAHAVYSKEAYAPFGETYNEAGTPDRSFTGQDQDVASGSGGTGTYDFLFRKYDPSAGRWLSPDPYGWGAVDQTTPQSLNRYAYVMNNPMSLSDPNGLDCEDTDSVSVGDCDPGNGYDSSGNGYNSYGDFSDVYAAGVTTTMTQVPCLNDSAGPCYAMTVAQSYFDCSLDLICNSSYQSAASGLNPSSPSLYPVGPAGPNNGNNCSVLDPNCKPMGPVQKYAAFLSCEAAVTINDLGHSGAAHYGAAAAGAVGMQQMYTYLWGTSKVIAKAGLKKGVPVIGEIAALYDAAMFDLEAVHANQVCTALTYGQ
jgi:RHS repeat-associated protein